jgi:hypothetical protein
VGKQKQNKNNLVLPLGTQVGPSVALVQTRSHHAHQLTFIFPVLFLCFWGLFTEKHNSVHRKSEHGFGAENARIKREVGPPPRPGFWGLMRTEAKTKHHDTSIRNVADSISSPTMPLLSWFSWFSTQTIKPTKHALAF